MACAGGAAATVKEDLVGWKGEELKAHVEVKGPTAKASWGSDCRNKCGKYQSQFHHMAEDNVPILVITHSADKSQATGWLGDAGVSLTAGAVGNASPTGAVLSLVEVADALRALEREKADQGKPTGGVALLEDMLDLFPYVFSKSQPETEPLTDAPNEAPRSPTPSSPPI